MRLNEQNGYDALHVRTSGKGRTMAGAMSDKAGAGKGKTGSLLDQKPDRFSLQNVANGHNATYGGLKPGLKLRCVELDNFNSSCPPEAVGQIFEPVQYEVVWYSPDGGPAIPEHRIHVVPLGKKADYLELAKQSQEKAADMAIYLVPHQCELIEQQQQEDQAPASRTKERNMSK